MSRLRPADPECVWLYFTFLDLYRKIGWLWEIEDSEPYIKFYRCSPPGLNENDPFRPLILTAGDILSAEFQVFK